MNPLATLKEKLMIKPNVEERERVAVVIKGVKKGRKPRAPKIKAAKVEEEEGEEEEEKPISEKIILEQSESDEEEKQAGPLIVDETEKGYDREALIKKLMESKKIKVTVKPNVQISEEKKIFEPVPLPPTTVGKKVKKIEAQKTLIIEGDEGEEKLLEPVPLEPEEEEFIMIPKKSMTLQKPKKDKTKKKEIKETIEQEKEKPRPGRTAGQRKGLVRSIPWPTCL